MNTPLFIEIASVPTPDKPPRARRFNPVAARECAILEKILGGMAQALGQVDQAHAQSRFEGERFSELFAFSEGDAAQELDGRVESLQNALNRMPDGFLKSATAMRITVEDFLAQAGIGRAQVKLEGLDDRGRLLPHHERTDLSLDVVLGKHPSMERYLFERMAPEGPDELWCISFDTHTSACSQLILDDARLAGPTDMSLTTNWKPASYTRPIGEDELRFLDGAKLLKAQRSAALGVSVPILDSDLFAEHARSQQLMHCKSARIVSPDIQTTPRAMYRVASGGTVRNRQGKTLL